MCLAMSAAVSTVWRRFQGGLPGSKGSPARRRPDTRRELLDTSSDQGYGRRCGGDHGERSEPPGRAGAGRPGTSAGRGGDLAAVRRGRVLPGGGQGPSQGRAAARASRRRGGGGRGGGGPGAPAAAGRG